MLISAKVPIFLLASAATQVTAFAPITRPFSAGTRLKAAEEGTVSITETTQRLYYVPSINDIDTGNNLFHEDVPALLMENDVGVKVKAMPRGANLCELSLDGTNYVWENDGIVRGSGDTTPSSGGAYYGPFSNSFPLSRGLILNGGIRFAAVTAEHGLYYDTDWPMEAVNTSPDEKSVEFTITDTIEQRFKIKDPFSVAQFNRADGFEADPNRMTKYPVTNMTFKFKITLKAGEQFARLSMTIINDTDEPCDAEAWLPMTFPINEKSEILSHQVERWRRDEWWNGFLPNVIKWADIETMKDQNGKDYKWNKPLSWPQSGIFYDFPHKNGDFHGCTIDENGKGVVYYAPESKGPHYTKMWGWGDPNLFNRTDAIENNPMAAGRPKTEYYEPWSSGFNFAFFQTTEFKANYEYNWEVAIVPVPSGLEAEKPLADKITTVDDYLKDLEDNQDLGSIGPVTAIPIGPK